MSLLAPQLGFTVEDQLRNLSDEQLAALEQELRKRQKGELATTVSGGLLRGAEGMLLTSQGRPLSEGTLTNPNPDKYEEILRTEQLKNQIDPSRRAAQMEMDEIERKKQEQAGAQVPSSARTVETTPASAGQEETPPMFIERPKGKNKYGIMEYETIDNPEYKAYEKKQEKVMEFDVKKEQLRKDLDSFFAIDDVLQKSRGKGMERFSSGVDMKVKGITQEDTLGRSVATHDAARKRLRVQLVRAAGDVGNINIVEQQAAEKMIPTEFDDSRTAELKRAYLKEIASAIESKDGNAVKDVINRFMQEDTLLGETEQQGSVPSVGGTFQGQEVINVKRVK